LGEQRDGLIIDWELFKEEVPADMRLVRPSAERAESGLEVTIKSLVTDRGLITKSTYSVQELMGGKFGEMSR
jgi:hypothetical protein